MKLLRYILPLTTLIVIACSTKKNTAVSRSYHDLTAHYNVYFNAKESYAKGIERLKESRIDNFYTVIPISLPPESDKNFTAEMDITVVKCLKLIKKHSITTPPKRANSYSDKEREFRQRGEWNKWVDDAYLLMGKAYFQKGEFYEAREQFEKVSNKLKYSDLKHEAILWLAKTDVENGLYSSAINRLVKLETDANTPAKLKPEIELTYASLNLKQRLNKTALPHLERAIELNIPKDIRSRAHFIIAQIYEAEMRYSDAVTHYNLSRKGVRNSRIDIYASLKEIENSVGVEPLPKLTERLTKMARLSKNRDILDRILLTAAKLYQKSDLEEEAVELYMASMLLSKENTEEKRIGSIELAQIFYNRERYNLSRAYYDTALTVTNIKDEYTPIIIRRATQLSRLTQNLDIILSSPDIKSGNFITEATDQMALYSGSTSNQFKIDIDKLVNSTQQNLNLTSKEVGSSIWYFSNPNTVKLGEEKFKSLWGDIKLEDNWRFRKSLSFNGNSDTNSNAESKSAEIDQVEATPSNLLTESGGVESGSLEPEVNSADTIVESESSNVIKSTTSNIELIDRVLIAASVYELDIKDIDLTISTYRYIVENFPDSEEAPFALYRLYMIADESMDIDQRDIYMGELTENYSNSDFYKAITIPNFLESERAYKSSIDNTLEEILNLYLDGDYQQVINMSANLEVRESDREVNDKLDFITTVSKGAISSNRVMVLGLEKYIDEHISSPYISDAQKILSMARDNSFDNINKLIDSGYINREILNREYSTIKQLNSDLTVYETEEDKFHYAILLYNSKKRIDTNRFIFYLSIYNTNNYPNLDFEIERQTLNEDLSMIVIRSLDSRSAAIKYIEFIQSEESPIAPSIKDDFTPYIITSKNFRTLLSEGDINRYNRFYIKEFALF